MALDLDQLDIVHNTAANRFEVQLGEKLGMIEYMQHGKNIIFTHTEVPVEYEGMGVANRIAYVALEYAQAEGLKVQPLCPFVSAYIRKHPEYQPITWGY